MVLDQPANDRPPNRGLPHRLTLGVLVVAALFGGLLIFGIAAMGSSNYAEGKCDEARAELQPQGSVTIIGRTAFPPRIVCTFSDGQQASRLDWMNMLGPPALVAYVICWVVIYRRVDRRFNRAALSQQ